MKTTIARCYRTKISLAPRASLRNASQKGGKELFSSYLKLVASKRCWRLLVRVDRWGWDSAETLLPLTCVYVAYYRNTGLWTLEYCFLISDFWIELLNFIQLFFRSQRLYKLVFLLNLLKLVVSKLFQIPPLVQYTSTFCEGACCQAPFCDEAVWGQFALDESLRWSA